MAWKCDQCGKGPMSGNKVSHANNKRRRRWMPNLHNFKTKVAGTVKTLRLCTRCIRSSKSAKVIPSARSLKKPAEWTQTVAKA